MVESKESVLNCGNCIFVFEVDMIEEILLLEIIFKEVLKEDFG